MALENISINFFYVLDIIIQGDYMAKMESCILYKEQSQKNDVIIVEKTDIDDYSLNDGKKAAVVMMIMMMMMMMMMMMELLLSLHSPLL